MDETCGKDNNKSGREKMREKEGRKALAGPEDKGTPNESVQLESDCHLNSVVRLGVTGLDLGPSWQGGLVMGRCREL